MSTVSPAQAINRPRTVQLGGETYSLYELTCRDLIDFEAFANAALIDQFDELMARREARLLARVANPPAPGDASAAEKYRTDVMAAVDHQKFLDRLAADRANKFFNVGSDEANSYMQSLTGLCEILFLSIRRGRPEFTREQARGLMDFLSLNEALELLPSLTGLFGAEGGADPKASQPATPGAITPSTGGEPAAG
jgi:hypothetical protein